MNAKNKKILFLHGLWGQNSSKPIFLKSLGFDVEFPILSDWSFSRSLEIAQEKFNHTRPDIIVGSSRGGAVAMNMDTLDAPLILLAPAWPYFGKKNTCKSNSIIIHSQNDEMIPVSKSVELSKKSNCKLIIIGKDHRLNCEEARLAIAETVLNI